MPSKGNQQKTSLPQRNQRNFPIAKATRLFSRIYTAIGEEIVGFDISSLNDELKRILTDVEESPSFYSTIYPKYYR